MSGDTSTWPGPSAQDANGSWTGADAAGSEAAAHPSGAVDDLDGLDGLESLDSLEDLGSLADLDDLEAEDSSSTALFAGDDGRLDLAQRQALVTLIKKRFVTAVADAKVWKTITADPQILRSRLHDLFMDLHIDPEREIAFKRQVTPEGGGSFPTLLYDTPWGREETIVLVYLRGRFRNEQAAGNSRVFVERHEIFEAVESHRPPTATDHAADRKRVVRAIEALNKAGLLIGAAQGDRFEVSAAIEVILPVEKLRELLDWLREESADPSDAPAEVLPDDESFDDRPDAGPGAATRAPATTDPLTFDDEQENPA